MSTEKTRGQLIGITDHCLVRYFERRFGVDIEQIKNEILPEHIRRVLTENPDKENYIINDLEFRISGTAVVTCVPLKSQEPLRTAKARMKHNKHKSNDKKNVNRHDNKKFTKRCKTH